MNRWSRMTGHDEAGELRRRNEIEARKLQLMVQEQKSKQEKLKFCPHCGKPLP